MPLHPGLVHLPIALAIVLPGVALVALIRGWPPARWKWLTLLQIVLGISLYAAMAAGESDAEVLRKTALPAAPLLEHETWGQRALVLSLLALLPAAVASRPGRHQSLGRFGLLALQIMATASVIWTAHLGGTLVYQHGAAELRKTPTMVAPPPGPKAAPGGH